MAVVNEVPVSSDAQSLNHCFPGVVQRTGRVRRTGGRFLRGADGWRARRLGSGNRALARGKSFGRDEFRCSKSESRGRMTSSEDMVDFYGRGQPLKMSAGFRGAIDIAGDTGQRHVWKTEHL